MLVSVLSHCSASSHSRQGIILTRENRTASGSVCETGRPGSDGEPFDAFAWPGIQPATLLLKSIQSPSLYVLPYV